MKFWMVKLSEPREEDRYFVVAAKTEQLACGEGVDRSIGDICSVTAVPLDSGIAQFDGCAEIQA